jgi:hypothetical protein
MAYKQTAEFIVGSKDNQEVAEQKRLQRQADLQGQYERNAAFIRALADGKQFSDQELFEFAKQNAKVEESPKTKEEWKAATKRRFDWYKERRNTATKQGIEALAASESQGANTLSEQITGVKPINRSEDTLATRIINPLLKLARGTSAAMSDKDLMSAQTDFLLRQRAGDKSAQGQYWLDSPEAKKITQKPLLEKLKGMGSEFKRAFSENVDVNQEYAEQETNKIFKFAIQQALALEKQNQTGDRKTVLKNAKQIYDSIVGSHTGSFTLRHPIAADAASQIAFDPLNIVNPIAVAGKALEQAPKAVQAATKVLPVAEKALPAAEVLAKYGPRTAQGALLGSIPGGDIAPLLGAGLGAISKTEKGATTLDKIFSKIPQVEKLRRRGEAELADRLSESISTPEVASETAMRDIDTIIAKNRLKADEKERLFTLFEDRNTPRTTEYAQQLKETISPAFGKAFEDVIALEQKHQTDILKTAAGKRISPSGMVQEGTTRAGYIPHKAKVEETESIFRTINPFKKKSSAASSAYARTEDATAYIKDPFVQYKAEYRANLPKAQAAEQIKNVVNTYENFGQYRRIDISNKATPEMKEKAIAEAKAVSADLSKFLGKEVIVVGQDSKGNITHLLDEYRPSTHNLSNTVSQIMLEKGRHVNTSFHIIPKEAVEVLDILAPSYNRTKAMGDFEKFWRSAIKPWTDLGKKGMTMGGGYAFAVRNTILTPQIDILNRGVKALDPNRILKAYQASFHMASGDWNKALKGLEKMGSTKTQAGFKTTWKELGELYKKHIGISTAEERSSSMHVIDDLRAVPATIPAKISKSTAEVASNVFDVAQKYLLPGSRRLQNTSENFQHFLTFSAVLEGKSQDQIAKAKRITDQITSNYRNMSQFERNILSQIIPFYAWGKYAGSQFATTIIKNPERLAAFLKMRGFYTDLLGSKDQKTSPQVEDFLKHQSMTIKTDKLNKDFFVQVLFNDPVTAGMAILNPVLNLIAPEKHKVGLKFEDQYSRALTGLTEFMTGLDSKTGDPIQGWSRYGAPLSDLFTRPFQRMFKMGKNLVDIPLADKEGKYSLDNIKNIAVLLGKENRPDLAFKWWMIYKATRDMTGLDIYPQSESKNTSREKERAVKILNEAINPKNLK